MPRNNREVVLTPRTTKINYLNQKKTTDKHREESDAGVKNLRIFKVAVTKMLQQAVTNMLETTRKKKSESHQRNTSYQKESNGNCRTGK